MPWGKELPDALNDQLEKVYKGCMKRENSSEEMCARVAWSTAKALGWKKDSEGKWKKKKKD